MAAPRTASREGREDMAADSREAWTEDKDAIVGGICSGKEGLLSSADKRLLPSEHCLQLRRFPRHGTRESWRPRPYICRGCLGRTGLQRVRPSRDGQKWKH